MRHSALNSPIGRLSNDTHQVLHADDGTSSEPIAVFQPSIRAEARDDPPSLPYLTLSPHAQEIRDKVVLSVIFIEKDRRSDGTLTRPPLLERSLLGLKNNLGNGLAYGFSSAVA